MPKLNKAKEMRRMSRVIYQTYGKAGFHQDKRTKRVKHMSTSDWLFEEEIDEYKIGLSNIVTAFDKITIGTKVINKSLFWKEIYHEVSKHDFSMDDVSGQGFIILPNAKEYLSSGIGKGTKNPEDYIVRMYRENPKLFLKRKFASEVDSGAVVIYTKEAYFADPDITEDEIKKIEKEGATHILVTVLAFSGTEVPLSPFRFVHNLAGGNNEALEWTAEEIKNKAKKIIKYWVNDNWHTVSD